ncbi:hypothetical protein J2M53_01245 [Arthrobacter sp. zg-ZUI100]|uniref:Uncharacterized protein n=1 Tax=Arthrobacter jiangjiafuii TaxID=2817475 RepID=A0A975M3N4_9MICC|nr:hypothetical protein [Arthrobacter jiangjiafuii]MBP3034880.1 hypothetical protein [Arthrobacter jiangjiafuii]MBP3044540.1 hypothetical protein [Arthrobacter jiangjiafuii]QWC09355.1 hypothetical protein KKR91_12775 [Arthrobacter jiangjiafuii]
MITLVVSALASLAAGFIVWGIDKRRSRYGIFLLPGLAMAAGLLLWLVLQLIGTGSDPDLFWLTWAAPPLAGAVAAVAAALIVGPRRRDEDDAALEAILRL